jgi:hypothetical protein
MRTLVTALLAALTAALGVGASATPAPARDLIEYALMADVPADNGAPPGPHGGLSRAAGTTVELTDFTIDGGSALLGAGLNSQASYERSDATGLDYAAPLLRDAPIDVSVAQARERDTETGLDHFDQSARLGAGIEFWTDDSRVNVILSNQRPAESLAAGGTLDRLQSSPIRILDIGTGAAAFELADR